MKEPILFNGKMRIRELGKPKHYNVVKWMLEDGLSKEEIRKSLFARKTKSVRQRLHGIKRRQNISSRTNRIRKVLKLF